MAICIKCTKFETTLDNELCNSCMGVPAKSSKPAWMSEKTPTSSKEKGSKKDRSTKNNIKSDKVKIEKSKKDSNLAFKFKKAIKPLLIVSAVAIILVGGVFTFVKLSPDEIQQGLVVKNEIESSNSFGLAIKLDRENIGNKYDRSLTQMVFSVGCDTNIDNHTSLAFTISAEPSALFESVLITTADELNGCLASKEAFLSDGISSLPVTIKSYDEINSIILLQAAITLPILAHNLSESDSNLFYTIRDNQLEEITPEIQTKLLPGSPIINSTGEAFAISSKMGNIKIKDLCSDLLTC
jgi:hypothetical protein